MATIFRGPLQVSRREVPPVKQIGSPQPFGLLLTLFAVTTLVPIPQESDSKSFPPQVQTKPLVLNADTSHGTPKTLLRELALPVGKQAAWIGQVERTQRRFLSPDTSESTAKTLIPELAQPVGKAAPYIAPVVQSKANWLPADTTQDMQNSLRVVPSALTGTLSQTLADVTLSGSGSAVIASSLATTLADATLAGVGTAVVNSTLSATLSDLTSTEIGSDIVSGSLAITLDDVAIAAIGDSAAPVVVTVTPQGGSSKKGRRKQIWRVPIVIDDEKFYVEDEAEAATLLEQVVDLAAEKVAADEPVPMPVIKSKNIDLQPLIDRAMAQMRVLLDAEGERARAEYAAMLDQDDDDALALLLH